MLPYTKFDGKLDGKTIYDFTGKLDYTLEKLEDRVEKTKEIINTQEGFPDKYFEMFFDQNREPVPFFKTVLNSKDLLSDKNNVCQQIEYIADYILFSKENMQYNDTCEFPILNSDDRLRIKNKEVSLSKLTNNYNGDDLIDDLQLKIDKKIHNYKKKPKQRIYRVDIENIPQVKTLQDLIENIRGKLNTEESSKTRNKYRQLLRDWRREQIDIKNIVLKPIEFKSVMPDETLYDFDSDTGYYKDNGEYKDVSINRINLGNPKHVYYLLRFYSELREQHFDNVYSDMRYILNTLEYLIDNADLKEFERDIIVWKIDGLVSEDIVSELQLKYGFEWTENKISKIYGSICRKIAKYFWDSYEEWFYIYKAKGNYKECSQCGENKLALEKYFSINKDSYDGLYSVCKKCRNSE